ncbi:MAG: hypothetical protein ACYCVH_08450 [Ignavibacteriaceae bacterium]
MLGSTLYLDVNSDLRKPYLFASATTISSGFLSFSRRDAFGTRLFLINCLSSAAVPHVHNSNDVSAHSLVWHEQTNFDAMAVACASITELELFVPPKRDSLLFGYLGI